MTIVVTDSGLGGISVVGELYRALKARPQYEKARIIFFNALFDEHSGYNRLESIAQKVNLFNAALNGMLTYAPDLICIACNTLSVLYLDTAFAQVANLPVIGIVELGVNYILQKVNSDQNAQIILFATPTTIQQGMHKHLLTQYFPETRIIEQACPELMFAIGDGEIKKTKRLIEAYTVQALQKLQTTSAKVYASLNCTHFGYYQDEFLQAFLRNGIRDVEVLNPNAEMVKLLVPEKAERTVTHSELSIEFVSRVKFNPKGMEALIPLLDPFSEEVVSAFRNYHWNPELF